MTASPRSGSAPPPLERPRAASSPPGRFGTPTEVMHAVLAVLHATWSSGAVRGIGR